MEGGGFSLDWLRLILLTTGLHRTRLKDRTQWKRGSESKGWSRRDCRCQGTVLEIASRLYSLPASYPDNKVSPIWEFLLPWTWKLKKKSVTLGASLWFCSVDRCRQVGPVTGKCHLHKGEPRPGEKERKQWRAGRASKEKLGQGVKQSGGMTRDLSVFTRSFTFSAIKTNPGDP